MNKKQIAKEIRSAIKLGDLQTVIELLEANPDLLDRMTPFGTWLHVAASKGKLEIVKYLINLDIDINKRGGVYDGSAVNQAASAGQTEIVRYLLSCGAQLDISDPARNPLFEAISAGNIEIVKMLIESGIDIHVKYNGEYTRNRDALFYALEQGQIEIAELLRSIGGSSEAEIKVPITQGLQEELLELITQTFDSPIETINEIIPGSRVAVTIHIIPPSDNRDFTTLVTTGMSDYPMNDLDGAHEFKHAELIQKLPPDWPINKEELQNNNYYWPFRWLRKIAHIPHLYDGWLREGVIIPNGEPPKPFASETLLSSILISPSEEKALHRYQSSDGRNINFYTLIPLYEEERELAVNKGSKYVMEKLKEHGVDDVLDIKRENIDR
ncbi:suppressor of fused domain protein [Bacillus sp. JZ8]